jgi:hypothetical protein
MTALHMFKVRVGLSGAGEGHLKVSRAGNGKGISRSRQGQGKDKPSKQGQVKVGTKSLTGQYHFEVSVGLSNTVQGQFNVKSTTQNGRLF